MRKEMKMNEFIMKSITIDFILGFIKRNSFYLRKKPSTIKTDQISQTEHPVDRIVYIDEPVPKPPSLATKAFVRNLNSSSVQQHMSWDSESIYSQPTTSDLFVDLFLKITKKKLIFGFY